MNNIITEENCVRINDALIPKNSIRAVKISTGVRLVFKTGLTQDLKASESKIDNVQVSSADDLFDYFKSNAFS